MERDTLTIALRMEHYFDEYTRESYGKWNVEVEVKDLYKWSAWAATLEELLKESMANIEQAVQKKVKGDTAFVSKDTSPRLNYTSLLAHEFEFNIIDEGTGTFGIHHRSAQSDWEILGWGFSITEILNDLRHNIPDAIAYEREEREHEIIQRYLAPPVLKYLQEVGHRR